jgi:selenium metabolism protein YedF
MIEIDARKLACPAPVLLIRDAVEKEKPGQIVIIVDNDAARQNVTRFLESRSYIIDIGRDGENFRITGRTDSESPAVSLSSIASAAGPAICPESTEKKIIVMITTDRIGFGDDELGKKLMISFIKTCREMGRELWRLVFLNNGVKLTVSGSEVLSELTALEKEGIVILVCGTCLTHFDLMDQKAVGQTTNMLDIVTAMQLADKVMGF